jgi:putative aminopeptidase FrvX
MKPLIQELVEAMGPSGYEGRVRAIVRAHVEPLADEVRVDNLGNLIARLGEGGPGGCTIMLAAHIDEIGVIVTHVDENGFARFLPVGGVQPRNCPGGRVRFLNGSSGVIGVERLEDGNKSPGFEAMFIDFGVPERPACPVKTGDVAVFERGFLDLGERLAAKAMDDRIGVVVLIEALRQMHSQYINSPNQVYMVFSVQEEVGLRGATTAAFGLQPDIGLAVDVTGSGDTPKGLRMAVALGKGPAIKVRDQGMLSDPRLVNWMAETAEKAGLPYQLEVLERGTTDARAIQIAGAGIPSGCISIPCRYIHSPSEVVDYSDVQNTVKLVVELLRGPVQLSDN